ncbi:POK8 protein, partial [Fregetta grallaria]|nr:POK8 protein [Fregetta grallaria]
MGALQPGLPNPAMIPEGWHLLVVDLKDYRLVSVALEPPLSPHCRARESHAIFHQNAKGLAQTYKLPIEEARAIIKACPICSHHNSGVG